MNLPVKVLLHIHTALPFEIKHCPPFRQMLKEQRDIAENVEVVIVVVVVAIVVVIKLSQSVPLNLIIIS